MRRKKMTFDDFYESEFTSECDMPICLESAAVDFTNEDGETKKLCVKHYEKKASYFRSHHIPFSVKRIKNEEKTL